MKSFKLTCVLSLLFISFNSHAQLTGIALGAAVDQLSGTLQQAIESSKNAGLNLEVQAGREVAISLENFKNVYTESLNKSMNKLDTTITNQFERIKNLTDEIMNKTVTSLSDFSASAQQIVNTLPFRNNEPQLKSFSPKYIVPSAKPYDITFICKGNFQNVGTPDFRPSLKIGTKIFYSGGGTQEIVFKVPASTFMSMRGIELNKFGYIDCDVSIPWNDRAYIFFHTKKTDHFHLYISSLPKQPGEIILTRTNRTTYYADSTISNNPPYRQSSCSDGGNSDKKDVPWTLRPTPGWHIIQGTSSFYVIPGQAQGDYGVAFISDAGDIVQYNVSTYHHGITGGPSGCLNFQIIAKENISRTRDTYTKVPFALNWGDSQIFNDPVGLWKIEFKAFDGSVNEFAGEDKTNPFIKVETSGMSYRISTADPSSLQYQ